MPLFYSPLDYAVRLKDRRAATFLRSVTGGREILPGEPRNPFIKCLIQSLKQFNITCFRIRTTYPNLDREAKRIPPVDFSMRSVASRCSGITQPACLKDQTGKLMLTLWFQPANPEGIIFINRKLQHLVAFSIFVKLSLQPLAQKLYRHTI